MAPTGEQLSYSDAYARSVVARVRGIEAGELPLLILDRTVFYPGGGGQPSDRGTLLRAADGRTWTVNGTQVGGEIGHQLKLADGGLPAEGDEVEVDIDGRVAAAHATDTALHAPCGVVWRDYGAQVTGGNMNPAAAAWFEFERMGGELVDEIEKKVNAELTAERDVRVNLLPRERLRDPRSDPDQDQPVAARDPDSATIEIVGLDLQADGCTHVANTREVGGIRVTGYEFKGRINKRFGSRSPTGKPTTPRPRAAEPQRTEAMRIESITTTWRNGPRSGTRSRTTATPCAACIVAMANS